jgi:N6-L-threonylcarbamoyladenine synthase
MRILAIETSCDESGVAIIDVVQNSATTVATIRSNQLASQAAIHAQYGGVFPTVAKREHARALTPLLVKALEESKDLHEQTAKPPQEVIGKVMEILQREQELFVQLALFFAQYGKPSIDAIAVTHGPGLEPALWVGVNFARSLATVWNVPLIAMNHMEGHIVAGLVAHTFSKRSPEVTLDTPAYPLLSLLISGGHTEFVLSTKAYTYHVIGTTRDDAAGECFDKCARMLDLPYPGGPQISKLAAQARAEDLPHDFTLPRPMLRDETLDMSFSGLKTAVLRLVQQHSTPIHH